MPESFRDCFGERRLSRAEVIVASAAVHR
jgi:hypothetical protein